MRIAGTLLAVVLLAGCAGRITDTRVDVYTFEVERVDQELTGNRGYLLGVPPTIDEDRPRTRTMIGVDVELPPSKKELYEEGMFERDVMETEPLRDVRSELLDEPVRVETRPDPDPVPEYPEDDWIK